MSDIEKLAQRRDRALEQFATLGDLRPGKLFENYRKCGKTNCHCAQDNHPGHGPSYILSRSLNGKKKSMHVPPGELEDTRALVREYERFKDIVLEFLQANEALAEAQRDRKRGTDPEKGGSSRWRSRPRSPPTSTV